MQRQQHRPLDALEILENCEINLRNLGKLGVSHPFLDFARDQLRNAIEMLEKEDERG